MVVYFPLKMCVWSIALPPNSRKISWNYDSISINYGAEDSKYSAHKHVYFLILNHTENTECWFTYKATGRDVHLSQSFSLAVNLMLNPKGKLADPVSTHLT